METINLRELQKRVVSPFHFEPLVMDLLTRIMAGSEKADDYEEILKSDKFFTKIICELASASMKTSVVSGLSHGVVVVGQQRIRNAVLGHSILRMFSPTADAEFKNLEESEKRLKYAVLAEEHARKCKNDYPGIAYACGFLFDVLSTWISKNQELAALAPFLESVWKHSLQTASMAWALATHERVLISHRKIIFAVGLLHEIGKLGLGVLAPKVYAECLKKMADNRDTNITDDIYEVAIEREHFDLSHPEVGAAILFETKFLREMEMEVDFHHDSVLLRTRNPDAFLGVAIINIADRVTWLMDRKSQFGEEELTEILKSHSGYFPLGPKEVHDTFAICRSKGWLNA